MSDCSNCDWKDCYNCSKSLENKPAEYQSWMSNYIKESSTPVGDSYCANCDYRDCGNCAHKRSC